MRHTTPTRQPPPVTTPQVSLVTPPQQRVTHPPNDTTLLPAQPAASRAVSWVGACGPSPVIVSLHPAPMCCSCAPHHHRTCAWCVDGCEAHATQRHAVRCHDSEACWATGPAFDSCVRERGVRVEGEHLDVVVVVVGSGNMCALRLCRWMVVTVSCGLWLLPFVAMWLAFARVCVLVLVLVGSRARVGV